MTNIQFQPPITDREAWEIGMAGALPYQVPPASSALTITDDAARAGGYIKGGAYLAPSIGSGGAKQGPTFEEDIPDAISAATPPGSPTISSMIASGGAVISSGGSGTVHSNTVVVVLSGTAVSSGSSVQVFNGGGIDSGSRITSAALAASSISSGVASVPIVITSGGWALEARLVTSGGQFSAPSPTYPVTITS